MRIQFIFFFFNDTATTEIYTLSLHDALPISARTRSVLEPLGDRAAMALEPMATPAPDGGARRPEALGHIGGRQALSQQEDNVSSEAQVLGRLMGTDQRVKRLALLL